MIKSLSIALALAASTAMAAECDTPVCAIKANKEFSKKYNPGINVFFNKENSAPVVKAIPELATRTDMQSMVDMLDANRKHMKTVANANCAVVGNSQNLRDSGYGQQIDAHDYVFRMNSAPTEGYEKDVGSKTTHHIFNYFFRPRHEGALTKLFNHYTGKTFNATGIRPYSPDTVQMLIPMPPGNPLRGEMENPYHRMGKYGDYKPFFTAMAADRALLKTPNLVLIHPEFVWYANLTWFTPPKRFNFEASSKGLFTTVMAMHMCGHIDLYGFGADKNGAWQHYYANDGSVSPMHRPTYQEELLDALEKAGVITQHRGNGSL